MRRLWHRLKCWYLVRFRGYVWLEFARGKPYHTFTLLAPSPTGHHEDRVASWMLTEFCSKYGVAIMPDCIGGPTVVKRKDGQMFPIGGIGLPPYAVLRRIEKFLGDDSFADFLAGKENPTYET